MQWTSSCAGLTLSYIFVRIVIFVSDEFDNSIDSKEITQNYNI